MLTFPFGPKIDEDDPLGLLAHRAGRRDLLRRGAAAGLLAGAAASIGGFAYAQETPVPNQPGSRPGDVVGSDTHSMDTGESSPVPVGKPRWSRYDPVLKPAEPGEKTFPLVAQDMITMVAPNVPYSAWTFNGSVPGPAMRARQGDKINVIMSVDPKASTAHSIDFHSAQTPPNVNFKTVLPGQSHAWSYTPNHPGAYMYHCGTPPVLMHIGTGMYGAMIIDPPGGWPPAQEFVFVQSDYYLKDSGNGIMVPDYTKMLGTGQMDYVVFNGYANQYVKEPIPVRINEPIRVFVVNAGPNAWSSFHVVGAIFDHGYPNANPKNALEGLQSISIGPGDGAAVEFTVTEPGEYVAVNHAFGHAAHGAIAVFQAS